MEKEAGACPGQYRVGTGEEALGAAFLFCIPESDFIIGQVVIAGGGLQA